MTAQLFLLILISFNTSLANCVYVKHPDVKEEFNITSHLQYEHIRESCKSGNRRRVCASSATRVCAARLRRDNDTSAGQREVKEFQNSCFLFFSNMCDHPGDEYYIAWYSDCDNYTLSRRSAARAVATAAGAATDAATGSATEAAVDVNDITTVATLPGNKSGLRMSTLYDINVAFDDHVCPFSCPDVYSPVCITVNRAFGLYYKFYTFINHCLGDQYYCKNWQEFQPPPDEDEELVVNSPLSWSYCSSSKFLQFARFSEVLSSMGHYGWLAGDFKHTHIVEPHERQPGFK